MRNLLIATSLVAVVALPSLASAQTRCQRQQDDNRAAGAVVGAICGALLGSAIAGRGDRTAGAVVGGVGGAVVGSEIAGSNGRCPEGYVVVQDQYGPPPPGAYGPPPPRPGYGPPPAGYGAPAPSAEALQRQEDGLMRRIDAARDRGVITRDEAERDHGDLRRIQDRQADMRARHGGFLTDDDRYYLQAQIDHLSGMVRAERVAGEPPPPPPQPTPVNVWVGAPQGLNQRADWLAARISADGARGILTPGGVREADGGLTGFRNEEQTLRTRDGGQLRDTDRDYLADRLEYLGQRLAWMESVHR